jgi:hypothetical protein
MIRLERMMRRDRLGDEVRFDPAQHEIEQGCRGRAARSIRTQVRQMRPVVVRAPRWSHPAGFLEQLALDLAVGLPGIGCRTVDLRPLKGRKASEAWQFTLHAFSQLGRQEWSRQAPTMVVDRGGFRFALCELLEKAHQAAEHDVALLAHGAEHVPVQIIEDLNEAWLTYRAAHPEGVRCTLLLTLSAGAGDIQVADSSTIDLVDLGASEAVARIGYGRGASADQLEDVARFTGGIPGLVDAVGMRVRSGDPLPGDPDVLLQSLGPLVDEIRGALDIVQMDSVMADRLDSLVAGEVLPQESRIDGPLKMAGLIRTVRAHGTPQVALRAPAIASLMA